MNLHLIELCIHLNHLCTCSNFRPTLPLLWVEEAFGARLYTDRAPLPANDECVRHVSSRESIVTVLPPYTRGQPLGTWYTREVP